MIPLLLWFVVGAVVGTVAALLVRDSASSDGLFGHIVVGIAVAIATGGWVAHRIGFPVQNPVAFLLGALAFSLFGAVAAAWLVQFLRADAPASGPRA
jgi:uncharacterized membrane protein YeaQ/YmgE (transglycosylase-associated protein family)